jgi:uncharacterized iron-regulated membrane protein
MFELEQLYLQLGLALIGAFLIGLLMWWVNRKAKGDKDDPERW